ncbi:hypothetical protein [Clostridium tetani]|uniref:hypothetical protein n=1 Tax=Clostridium tetani TaxID=1513 RepID=UPI00100B9F0F|nr:hypothetical protein [Clostridium tetani]RXM70352.1 hypothetical protein DP139_06600 [Clostridium tetani]
MDNLLKRYGGNLSYVEDLPGTSFINLVEECINGETRDNLFKQYLAILPMYMGSKEKPLTFNDYYKKLVPNEFSFTVGSKSTITNKDKGKEGFNIAKMILNNTNPRSEVTND